MSSVSKTFTFTVCRWGLVPWTSASRFRTATSAVTTNVASLSMSRLASIASMSSGRVTEGPSVAGRARALKLTYTFGPLAAVAGSLAAKKIVPPSAGTFPTDNGLFVGLLVGVILIIGGLTFFPALALGPVVEHLAMHAGTLY